MSPTIRLALDLILALNVTLRGGPVSSNWLLASKECEQGLHKTLHVSKFAREELAAAFNLHVSCAVFR